MLCLFSLLLPLLPSLAVLKPRILASSMPFLYGGDKAANTVEFVGIPGTKLLLLWSCVFEDTLRNSFEGLGSGAMRRLSSFCLGVPRRGRIGGTPRHYPI